MSKGFELGKRAYLNLFQSVPKKNFEKKCYKYNKNIKERVEDRIWKNIR